MWLSIRIASWATLHHFREKEGVHEKPWRESVPCEKGVFYKIPLACGFEYEGPTSSWGVGSFVTCQLRQCPAGNRATGHIG